MSCSVRGNVNSSGMRSLQILDFLYDYLCLYSVLLTCEQLIMSCRCFVELFYVNNLLLHIYLLCSIEFSQIFKLILIVLFQLLPCMLRKFSLVSNSCESLRLVKLGYLKILNTILTCVTLLIFQFCTKYNQSHLTDYVLLSTERKTIPES